METNTSATKYFIEDCSVRHELKKLDSFSDLGVKFDNKPFLEHMNKKIKKAHSILGVIKRNFIYVDKNTFILLYKAMVRPHLEYVNSVWCPYKQDAQLLQRDRAAGCVTDFAKSRTLERGDNDLRIL